MSPREWDEALAVFGEEEKAMTRQLDALNAKRRWRPMTAVKPDDLFEGTAGSLILLELFDGGPQRIVYHFMSVQNGKQVAPAAHGWWMQCHILLICVLATSRSCCPRRSTRCSPIGNVWAGTCRGICVWAPRSMTTWQDSPAANFVGSQVMQRGTTARRESSA